MGAARTGLWVRMARTGVGVGSAGLANAEAQTPALVPQINGWSVANVVDMSYLFSNAEAFDKTLQGWNVSSVTNFDSCFLDPDAFTHWRSLATWQSRRVERPPPEPGRLRWEPLRDCQSARPPR